jgi:hypothetical protein
VPQSIVQPLRRWEPERIGSYSIIGRLGAGAMGQVFLARSAAGRLVAVKTIRVELAEEAGFRARFAREVAAASRVSGVFTAVVIEADPDADLPWVATAYVPAPSLSTLVRQSGPLPVPAVRWLAAGCAEALQSIHAAGLLHRDVKPSNVLVAPDGPRVIDFGIARAAEEVSLTLTGVWGTPGYLAPEQARDVSQASPASDVFSLGATLVYAATGHAPYQGETAMDILVRLATEPPDLTSVPGELVDLVAACLQRAPRDRPTSKAILDRLGPFASQAGPGHSYLPEAAMAVIAEYQQAPLVPAPAYGPGEEPVADTTGGSWPAVAPVNATSGSLTPLPGFHSIGGHQARPGQLTGSQRRGTPNAEPAAAASVPGGRFTSMGRGPAVWPRWLLAVFGALAVYLGCWGGLTVAHVTDPGTDVGIAVIPFAVSLAILGAWALRVPRTERRWSAPAWQLPRVKRHRPADAAGPEARGSDGAQGGNGGHGRGGDRPSDPGTGGQRHEDRSRPRFLTGVLPERAPADTRITLLVRITRAAASGSSVMMDHFSLGPAGATVTVTVSAPGLRPAGDLEQDVPVPPDADSEPVRFGFITGPVGLHPVEVRAFIGGTCLGELVLQISVQPGGVLEEGRLRTAPMAGLAAEPGEVTLQVSRTVNGGYGFQLLSEALYPMVLIDRLAGDPAKVVGQLVGELRAMSQSPTQFGSSSLARKRLRSLGAKLWADVVPITIREQFWDQRDRIKLFTIASDLDTVPWELLYPVDLNNEDGFLVEQFPVVRRVYGQGRARVLRMDGGAGFIVPPGSPANALDEVAAVRGILKSVVHRGTAAGLAQVHELLEAVPSVLHFAGHNTFSDESGSLIRLDGGAFRPNDISYAKQKRAFAAVSPLVFFNGCRTAGEVPGFTEMNGWATEFMGAGAAAFVGSLWAVRSNSAKTFAEEFYRALVRDQQPLGAASLRARQAIAADESDPTWLAYTVYGNPAASVQGQPYS